MRNATERYAHVRTLTEQLAEPLTAEDQTVQSMPDVSPTKWHRAHTTWFFETFILAAYERDFHAYHDGYWTLFNSYYESLGARHPRAERGVISRPGATEVGAYRKAIDRQMLDLLSCLTEAQAAGVVPLLELGLNHEQQHQELLLMDIKHVLSRNPLRPAAYSPGQHHVQALPMSSKWTELPGGVIEVGADSAAFSFDNEQPRHAVLVQPFRIADRLVTNREWMEFMSSDGYGRAEYWLSDGWATVQAEGWSAPLYWINDDGAWLQHTLSGTRAIALDEPVIHISHYEADAYASWAGARLPTEFEWELAAATGELSEIHDSAWQWTASAYLPYPGFTPARGAVGEYNGKFMSGQMVLRGGSCVTPAGHARPSYRNFFPPHSRWAFSGVRLAQGTDAPPTTRGAARA